MWNKLKCQIARKVRGNNRRKKSAKTHKYTVKLSNCRHSHQNRPLLLLLHKKTRWCVKTLNISSHLGTSFPAALLSNTNFHRAHREKQPCCSHDYSSNNSSHTCHSPLFFTEMQWQQVTTLRAGGDVLQTRRSLFLSFVCSLLTIPRSWQRSP